MNTAYPPFIIDAHQHFWHFNPVRDQWIGDDMKVIQKDFLPADLLPVLEASGVSGSVIVQSDQSEEENRFQLNNASENDFIKGVVGWVDLQADNVEERLLYYMQFDKCKGFRHVLQGETDRRLMLTPSFKRGIALLTHFGFTYDLLILPDQIQPATELVALYPEQQFVIDHIAKPLIKEKQIDKWAVDMRAIAHYENVYCKISGLVTEAHWKNWKEVDFKPYLDIVVEAFGMKRIMFGSDWPVCLVAASYQQMLDITMNYFSAFSPEEKNDFFADNAMRFYKLKA